MKKLIEFVKNIFKRKPKFSAEIGEYKIICKKPPKYIMISMDGGGGGSGGFDDYDSKGNKK